MKQTIDLTFAFIIFFITLGPLKTIPVFGSISNDLNKKATRYLAFRSTVISTIIVFLTAIVFSYLASAWNLSPESLMVTGGILLFISASHMIFHFTITPMLPQEQKQKDLPAEIPSELLKVKALSPLAIPATVTPIGVVAILFFSSMGKSTGQIIEVFTLLLAIMTLNLLGMLYAKPILKFVGITFLQIIGWIFAILQSILAIQILYNAYQLILQNQNIAVL